MRIYDKMAALLGKSNSTGKCNHRMTAAAVDVGLSCIDLNVASARTGRMVLSPFIL